MPTPIIGALPVILTNGTIADATQVMADFNYILAQVNANGAPITGGTYLPLTGGTLTGNLSISPASGGASLVLDSITGTGHQIFGRTGGSNRWSLQLGNGVAESGSNVGADFGINRFTDAGAIIDTPLTITRASGLINTASGININGSGAGAAVGPSATSAALSLNKTASGGSDAISAYTGGSLRWQFILGNTTAEGAGNAGSDASMNAFDNTGTLIGNVLTVVRATRVCTFGVAIVNGPSDRSLKENIAPLEGSLDKVAKLQGVSFNMIGDESKRRQIGLIAQDVEPVVPEVIQEFRSGEDEPKLALDYPKLVALLIESIKELTARVASLEAKVQST